MSSENDKMLSYWRAIAVTSMQLDINAITAMLNAGSVIPIERDSAIEGLLGIYNTFATRVETDATDGPVIMEKYDLCWKVDVTMEAYVDSDRKVSSISIKFTRTMEY